jgi:hypothetical protein
LIRIAIGGRKHPQRDARVKNAKRRTIKMAKKRFFEQHAKSSAAMISLGIHAVLIVVALSFVAVTVITKEEQVFEAKPVKRPKMALKKLQVPINIKRRRCRNPSCASGLWCSQS